MIDFFDSNCMYGNRSVVREGSVVTEKEYEEMFERARIGKVLAYHSDAANTDLISGNELICELQRRNSRYTAQWCVMPNSTGEFFSSNELILKMRENSVKSVRVFPVQMSFSISPYSCGELFSELEKYRVPLFINNSQITYQELYALLMEYPHLPVILCGLGHHTERQIYPIAAACPNLYIETSLFFANNSIEMFVKRFGAERLIFGTGTPENSACGAVASILYACISEADKQRIAAENLEAILEEVKL